MDKKKMKKVKKLFKSNLTLLLIICICACSLYTGQSLYVKAVTAVEKETGTTFTDALKERDSVNLYRLTTKTDGYFRVNLTTEATEDEIEDGWNITILDASNVVLKKYSRITSDYTSPRIMLPKGETFYIKITAYSTYKYDAPTGVTYSLCVNETVEKNWETENNATQNTADVIPAETTMYGTIWITGDTDVYQYTVTKDGYLRFRFAHEGTNTSEVNRGWKVIIYDAEMKEIYSKSDIASDGYYSRYLNFKKGTVLYIKVLADDPGMDAWEPIDALYSITPIETEALDWELENNNIKTEATELISYKIGTGHTTSDIDYYVYNATGNNEVELDFTIQSDSTSVKNGWLITVENEEGKQLTSIKKVQQDSKCTFQTEKGKKYYIQVRPYELDNMYRSPVDVQYKIGIEVTKVLNNVTPKPTETPKVTESPKPTATPKPTSKSAPAVKGLSVKSVKKKKVTLSWKKASGAAGYQIYRKSGSGSYKLVKTVKSAGTTKWTDTSAKKGKKYTYKIRSYIKGNGAKKYGKFSGGVSVKAK